MARRKRLTPPRPDYLATQAPAPAAGPLSMPPIAQVAGEAASSAALLALSDEMAQARAQGRFIEALPLAAVEARYLVRDRVGVADEDQAALLSSLRERGQQTPIEVVDLGAGRYGLIAGWRRLMALQALFDESGEARFATIDARVTRPGETAEAYRAMVEENEIRVGLSHFERARIALRAVEEGVYPDASAALNNLYSSASRAKKSKIRSFMGIVQHLDGDLQYPASLGERLGLALAKQISDEPGFLGRVQEALREGGAEDAQAEQEILRQTLTQNLETKSALDQPAPLPPVPVPGVQCRWMEKKGEVRLFGAGVDAAFVEELRTWLAERGG